MKDSPGQPDRPKVIVKPMGTAKKVGIKEEPIEQPYRKKGLLRRIVEVVVTDIRNLPTRIWGQRKKKVKKMPRETDSWEKWKEYFDITEWKPKEEK